MLWVQRACSVLKVCSVRKVYLASSHVDGSEPHPEHDCRAHSNSSACLQESVWTTDGLGCQVAQVINVKVLEGCSGLAGLNCVAQVHKLQH